MEDEKVFDCEIVGTMMVNNKVVVAYNRDGEVIFAERGWDLQDGNLVQVPIVN